VIDSSVEIAKAKGNPGIGKFVNGVLRNLQRKGTPKFTQIKDAIAKLSIQYSIPLWLMEKLVNQLGIESANQLGASLFT
ncbi:transcription antitermination factor NusB, partial [Clostridium tepidum]